MGGGGKSGGRKKKLKSLMWDCCFVVPWWLPQRIELESLRDGVKKRHLVQKQHPCKTRENKKHEIMGVSIVVVGAT